MRKNAKDYERDGKTNLVGILGSIDVTYDTAGAVFIDDRLRLIDISDNTFAKTFFVIVAATLISTQTTLDADLKRRKISKSYLRPRSGVQRWEGALHV